MYTLKLGPFTLGVRDKLPLAHPPTPPTHPPPLSGPVRDNPQVEEAAVQSGLIKWVEGESCQPPIWEVPEVMEDTEIAQQDTQDLKTAFGCH